MRALKKAISISTINKRAALVRHFSTAKKAQEGSNNDSPQGLVIGDDEYNVFGKKKVSPIVTLENSMIVQLTDTSTLRIGSEKPPLRPP